MRTLKAGRFVTTKAGTGVVFGIKNNIAVVHLMDDNGETTKVEAYPVAEIKLTEKPLPARVAVK